MKKRILITGASGFIGKVLVPQLSTLFDVIPIKARFESADEIKMNNIDCLIHLAGLAHQTAGKDDYYKANYLLTKKLASNALRSNVKQFIYLSSSKVFGESSLTKTYNENTLCNPKNPYAKSKLMAEEYLNTLSQDIKIAVIRPPLVYGPGAKGNLLSLMRLIEKHSLLPLGGINNQRSMVYVNNLIALMQLLIEESAQGTYLISDNQNGSTTELVKLIANQFDKRTRVFKMPLPLRLLLKQLKPSLMMRLYDSFVTLPSNNLTTIGFKPSFTYEEGIADMVSAYLRQKDSEANTCK